MTAVALILAVLLAALTGAPLGVASAVTPPTVVPPARAREATINASPRLDRRRLPHRSSPPARHKAGVANASLAPAPVVHLHLSAGSLPTDADHVSGRSLRPLGRIADRLRPRPRPRLRPRRRHPFAIAIAFASRGRRRATDGNRGFCNRL